VGSKLRFGMNKAVHWKLCHTFWIIISYIS
jgi:hypothetical protein